MRVRPFLWYTDQAEEAARFYASVVPNSRVGDITVMPGESPSGPEGSVKVVEFTLAGQEMRAMSAGKLDPFNHAVSFEIECDTQDEVDRLWDGLMEGGGEPEECGWLKDRYGLRWQITPRMLNDAMKSPDREAARRATQAMLKMIKLDIAALQKAFDGD